MGQVIDMMLRVKGDAAGLEVVAKEAKKTSDALEEVEADAKQAGDALIKMGDKAGAAGADIQQAGAKLDKFSDGAGNIAGIAGGLATGLDKISPAAGGAVRAIGDMTTGMQAAGQAFKLGAGPIAILTLAIGAGIKIWEHFNEKQKQAQAEMEATISAANALKVAMGQWDFSKANAQLENMVANGKVTNREMAVYTAHTKAHAESAEVMDEARARHHQATLDRAAAGEAIEADKRKLGFASLKVQKKLDVERMAAFRRQSAAMGDISRINAETNKQAELMIDTWDAVARKAVEEKKAQDESRGGGGGAKKGATEFDKLIDAADKLASVTPTKLEQLNAMLVRLQAEVGGNEAAAGILGRRLAMVKTARDAESQSIQDADLAKQATAMQAAANKSKQLATSIDSLVAAYEEPISASAKLKAKKGELMASWKAIEAAAQKAGITGTSEFKLMADNMEKQLGRVQRAINSLQPPDAATFREKMGAGLKGLASYLTGGGVGGGGGVAGAMEGAVGVMASGGASALSALAGPAGGAVSAAIGLGQQGDAAYDAEVQEKAQKAAAKRQEKMAKQGEAMRAQGYSEEQISEAGFGQEAVAKAGEVTGADIKKAEAGTDRGEMMGEVVQQAVTGLIEGIKSIIIGLPEILEVLIPALITELPTALITASLKMIPKLVVSIFRDLPVALWKGFVKGFQQVWRAIKRFFADLFSFGFQQGGYVPSTGSYILHQGERVVPNTGAATGGARQGLAAFGGPSGAQVTVNTAVVDPDTIPALGRMIDSALGTFGSGTVPVLGTTNPTTSL